MPESCENVVALRQVDNVGRRRRRRCNGGRRLVILEAGKNVERRKGFAAGRGLRKTGRGGLRSIVFSALVRYGRGRVGIRLLSPVRGRGIGPFDTFRPVILWLGLRALIGTGSKCAAVPYRAKEPFCLACNRTRSWKKPAWSWPNENFKMSWKKIAM